jgi:LysM repeat protein
MQQNIWLIATVASLAACTIPVTKQSTVHSGMDAASLPGAEHHSYQTFSGSSAVGAVTEDGQQTVVEFRAANFDAAIADGQGNPLPFTRDGAHAVLAGVYPMLLVTTKAGTARFVHIGPISAVAFASTAPVVEPKPAAPSEDVSVAKAAADTAAPLPAQVAAASIPVAPAPPPISHVPQSGYLYHLAADDTLWSVARRFDVAFADLLAVNHITADTVMLPGATLVLPPSVRPTEASPSLHATGSVTAPDRTAAQQTATGS